MTILFLAMMFMSQGPYDIDYFSFSKNYVGTEQLFSNSKITGLMTPITALEYESMLTLVRILQRKQCLSIFWCTTESDHLKWKPPKIKSLLGIFQAGFSIVL